MTWATPRGEEEVVGSLSWSGVTPDQFVVLQLEPPFICNQRVLMCVIRFYSA